MINAKTSILNGEATLGIEFGSTRIKAVLIALDGTPIASGSYEWENQLVDGLWTYALDEIWHGLQQCYADLAANVRLEYSVPITRLHAIGISAMMHGYMPFHGDELLVPFRTWRNTNTARAAHELSELFGFNIPLRWSVAHLYQAILDHEPHVPQIDFITTLAGYIHWQLTGRRVLGVGDASGMFPIDTEGDCYDEAMLAKFDALLPAPHTSLSALLPQILYAGDNAGALTTQGALRLDPTGTLQAGVPMCPPEGDAGTGMVATNAVRQRTGNVSAGTSSFSMIVLERPLTRPYEAIDIVTTPDGSPVAMVHCNNCTSDLNAWVSLFADYTRLLGVERSADEIFGTLYRNALTGDADCGGLVAYNYVSGEPVTGLAEGRPLFMRSPNDRFTLANAFRAHLYAAVSVLKVGNDILIGQEHVAIDRLTAHGGLFRTPVVGQRVLAAALATPVSVMTTAGEGGAWGIALLALYHIDDDGRAPLADWLDRNIFNTCKATTIEPCADDVAGFNRYIEHYKQALPVEQAATQYKQ